MGKNKLPAGADLDKEQIVKAMTTWANFTGYSGESCNKCGTTFNLLGRGCGWVCPECEGYNAQDLHHLHPVYKNPMFGPTEGTIRAASEEARQILGE